MLVDHDIDQAGLAQDAEAGRRGPPVPAFHHVAVVAGGDELEQLAIAGAARRIAVFALEQTEQEAVVDGEARFQRLGRAVHQALEGAAVEVHVALLRRLLHVHLLAARGLGLEAQVLDDVGRRLRHHPAAIVEALAPGAARDLLEFAHAQDAVLLAVVLAQLGEQHRADGNVHAHAQGVGAADDLEQSLLAQALDQAAVARQKPAWCRPIPWRRKRCSSLP
jgi:hypothetical protein